MDVESATIDTSYDRSNLLGDYLLWCEDGVNSAEAVLELQLDECKGRVFYAGMGASAAPGEVLSDYLSYEYSTEIRVVSSHLLPHSFTKDDVLLAVSLSGSTEETLSVVEKLLGVGGKVVGFSSGGKLKQVCESRGAPHVQLERRLTSRSSFPLILGKVSKVIGMLLGIELGESVSRAWTEIKPHVPTFMSLHVEGSPSSMARWLYNSPHITIYYSPFIPSVGKRARYMLSENAKSRCNASDILEVQHDGISAWEGDYGTKLLLLPSPYDDSFVTSRFRAVGDVVRSLGFGVRQLQFDLKSLAFLLESVYYIDLMTIYLALLKKVDPSVNRSQRLVRSRLDNTPV